MTRFAPQAGEAGLLQPRLLWSGETALTVEFGREIDEAANARVLALDAALGGRAIEGMIDRVPTYRSLTIHVDPLRIDHGALCEAVLSLAAAPPVVAAPRRRWRVPVLYGGESGIDLDALAQRHGLTSEALVALHAGAVYTVAMIGFLPGFTYLGGLDPRLATPRRVQPRPKIPSQSISIGGAQGAIGSTEGPSGWHLIGRTPARPFRPTREPIFLFEPGDEIVFEPIAAEAWTALDHAAEAGDPVARIVRS